MHDVARGEADAQPVGKVDPVLWAKAREQRRAGGWICGQRGDKRLRRLGHHILEPVGGSETGRQGGNEVGKGHALPPCLGQGCKDRQKRVARHERGKRAAGTRRGEAEKEAAVCLEPGRRCVPGRLHPRDDEGRADAGADDAGKAGGPFDQRG